MVENELSRIIYILRYAEYGEITVTDIFQQGLRIEILINDYILQNRMCPQEKLVILSLLSTQPVNIFRMSDFVFPTFTHASSFSAVDKINCKHLTVQLPLLLPLNFRFLLLLLLLRSMLDLGRYNYDHPVFLYFCLYSEVRLIFPKVLLLR